MDYQTCIYFALLLLCAIAIVNGGRPQKIVGGSNAELGEFPYLVSIRDRDRHFCGGAIISERHILTAAHCVKNKMDTYYPYGITVVTGTISLNRGGQSHKVHRAVVHPGFTLDKKSSLPHDVAVLTLSSQIEFNRYQKKVSLASHHFVPNSKAVIAGWGFLSSYMQRVSHILKKVYPKVARCASSLTRGQLCGIHEFGQDTCQGDSGGPLVQKNEVIGIVSWGSEICAVGQPDVYTNVFYYRDFILTQMNRL